MKTKMLKTDHRLMKIAGIALIVGLFLSSCEEEYYGYDGLPGEAFLSLNWNNIEPSYLEVGTGEIPSIFYYGDYYKVHPGKYTLYYEVNFWNDNVRISNAYETDYEIWINQGEPGGYHYNGCDGSNTYFSIALTPNGPEFYEDFNYKSAEVNKSTNELGVRPQNTIIKIKNNYTIKLTFRKVAPKKH